MADSGMDAIKNILLNNQYSYAIESPQSRVEYLLLTLLAQGGGGGGGSGGGGDVSHLCGQGEYDPETGVPTIENPSSSTTYFVPNGQQDGNDRYAEWRYIDGNWEKMGDTTSLPTALTDMSDVAASNLGENQVLTYDENSSKWENKTLNAFCFQNGTDEDYVFDGGSAADLE